MINHDQRRCTVLLTIQQALLGEVSSNLRAVLVSYAESSLHFEAYYDGEIGEDEREAMSMVETELMSQLASTETVTHALVRSDLPELLPKDRIWVYYRKEPLL